MKVNLGDKPPMLGFFEDTDDAFGLQLKRFTGTDRMAVVDAMTSGSVEAVEVSAQRLVVDWTGVKDENGRDIPLESEGAKGRQIRNLDAFMGALSLVQQLEVTLGIVAFVGVPKQDLQRALDHVKELTADGADGAVEGVDLDPTPTPAGATRSDASPSSSS